ncbi:sulfur carrier protein ThiS [Aquimarina sp. 2201CG14-23]|uniref:sulfur carrier protein ThiS n=1 Tax=Aquimarina mycalae TaxID=3040073 RepID=UPI0024782652|nr:sulfur carrier protein ThiS [Aquimarina sp. 2201CG14-23]MDH7446059.1 sulfur carrier protein ThiS [Aquimarina sp. 2201CG14-23]
MIININNQTYSISENCSVKKLLKQLDIVTNGIAIAINNEIVPRENWNHKVVREHDIITIIQATQGG